MSLLTIILFTPVLTSLIITILRKKITVWIGKISTLSTFLVLLLIVYNFTEHTLYYKFDWINLSNLKFDLSFRLDKVAFLMLIIIHFIAFLVQIYSIKYIDKPNETARYFALIQFFIFAICGIIVSNNLFLTFCFWEIVGLASYMLIGFWNKKSSANSAAKKAFLVNRIGDIGFLIGIILTLVYFKTIDYQELEFIFANNLPILANLRTSIPTLTIIGLLLFCGTIGKSALWPLSTWLPDAMEGPTPVSALIHAATMVAAGVYLLFRISFLLTDDALFVVILIGLSTSILASYRAIFQFELKKILAFSTVSQLGLMVLAIGVGAKEIGLFHLTTHAFFKAGLFLCAGIIIHYYDPKNPKNLKNILPITYLCFTICGFALMGLPFTSGFVSKDSILIQVWDYSAQRGGVYYLISILSFTSVLLTSIYTVRIWKLLFWGENSLPQNEKSYENYIWFKIPIISLAVLSFFIFFSFNPFEAKNSWILKLFFNPVSIAHHNWIGILSVFLIVIGGFIGFRFKFSESWASNLLEQIYNKYLASLMLQIASISKYIDLKIIDKFVVLLSKSFVLIAHFFKFIDTKIIDGLLNVLVFISNQIGNRTRIIQNGKLQNYWIATFVGLLIFMLFWII